MKWIMIKVGVVSPYTRRQWRSAARFDRRSSRVSTRTQQQTRVLHYDTCLFAVTPVVSWTEAYALNKVA